MLGVCFQALSHIMSLPCYSSEILSQMSMDDKRDLVLNKFLPVVSNVDNPAAKRYALEELVIAEDFDHFIRKPLHQEMGMIMDAIKAIDAQREACISMRGRPGPQCRNAILKQKYYMEMLLVKSRLLNNTAELVVFALEWQAFAHDIFFEEDAAAQKSQQQTSKHDEGVLVPELGQ